MQVQGFSWAEVNSIDDTEVAVQIFTNVINVLRTIIEFKTI